MQVDLIKVEKTSALKITEDNISFSIYFDSEKQKVMVNHDPNGHEIIEENIDINTYEDLKMILEKFINSMFSGNEFKYNEKIQKLQDYKDIIITLTS